MAEGRTSDGRSERLDRVSKPEPGVRRRDAEGKEALYSTAPTAAPSKPLEISCRRCGVSRGLSFSEGLALLRPPFLLNPLTGTLWSRCPTCGRRSLIDVATGQAIRALLDRRPDLRR